VTKLSFVLSGLLAALLGIAASTSINVATQVMGLLAVANGGTGVTTANAGTVFAGPTSGSGAPSFRTLTLPDAAGAPKPEIKRWAYVIESGTTMQYAGEGNNNQYGSGTDTDNLATTTDPAYHQCQAGSTSGNNCRWNSSNSVSNPKIWVSGLNIYFQEYAALQTAAGSSGDNERVWFCLTDQDSNTHQSTDTPAGNYACFRYSAATDGGVWKGVTKDGTTQSTCSSAAVDTSYHKFEFTFDDSVPNVTFTVDGGSSCTISSHLPTSGTAMQFINAITTTSTGATHSFRLGWAAFRADH